jgi:glutaminase
MTPPDDSFGPDVGFVSTGHLPPGERAQELVDVAYERFRSNTEGANSRVYPALARVPPELFGICVVGANGRVRTAGDVDVPFAIMSVAKPFVFALVCRAIGPEAVRLDVGVNATGLPFNSPDAVRRSKDGRTNPMVNPGAIATTSLVPGESGAEKWQVILDGLSRFAGRTLALDEDIYRSASATNHRNRALAGLLQNRARLFSEPAVALDLYTRQSCLSVTACDLAVMGATLANGGVNPVTGVTVVEPVLCHYTLATMTTAGLYESSGDWLYDVGLPAKSGIGGGIVTISPGKGGLGTFAPPLNDAGNSVKGQLVATFLSRQLGLDLLVSQPVGAGLAEDE